MPSDRRRTCLVCGNHESEVGPISWRGNCEQCGLERMIQARLEFDAKRGPIYRKWKRNLHAATAE